MLLFHNCTNLCQKARLEMTHFILNCVNETIMLYSPPLQNTFIPLPLCVIGSSNVIKGTMRASLVAQWWRIRLPKAGNMDLIPGLGRCHRPWSSKARAPQLLGLCSGAWEPQLLSPRAPTTEAHTPYRLCSMTREATAMRSPCTASGE